MKLKLSWCLLFMIFSLSFGFGQAVPDSEPSKQDSIQETDFIPLNEVLIAAGESRIRSVRIKESLMSTESIERESRRFDSTLVLIDSALTVKRTVDYSSTGMFKTITSSLTRTCKDGKTPRNFKIHPMSLAISRRSLTPPRACWTAWPFKSRNAQNCALCP